MGLTEPDSLSENERRTLVGLLRRMTIYYAVLAAIMTLAWLANPALIEALPLGGVGDIAGFDDPAVEQLEEALLNAGDDELEAIATRVQLQRGRLPAWLTGAVSLLVAMLATLVLMLPVAWVHKAIHTEQAHDHSLDETALVLPAVVAGIVTVVQHSLALAFSLAGIVAGVQFRRALSDTFDTLFIFVAIGVGIAAGIESLEIGLVMSLFFGYSTVLVCLFGDGLESQFLAEKKRRRKEKKAAKAAAAAAPESAEPDR